MNVFLSQSEVEALRRDYPSAYQQKIDRLSLYMESSGNRYRDHYAKLREWLAEDAPRASPKRETSYDLEELDRFETLDFVD